jgi:protein-S-isoprenylcysteine O-methyltransferase Ste14
MLAFEWTSAILVSATLIYVSFVLTVPQWMTALRKGQAVTLLPERQGRKLPLWAQVGVLVVGLAIAVPFFYYLWIPIRIIPYAVGMLRAVMGLVIYLVGLTFVLWARRSLGRFWGVSTSSQVRLLDDHQLIQTGPYALVRHPMYSGWWACMLGLTLLYPVWAMLLMFAFSLISFFGRARREETVLSQRFGVEWTEYKKQTKFIVPFLY